MGERPRAVEGVVVMACGRLMVGIVADSLVCHSLFIIMQNKGELFAMGNNTKIGGGGFHHVAMRVKDFDASLKFYVDGLGFVVAHTWGQGDKRAAMLDTGDGNCLEVFAGGTAEPKPEGAVLHMAFRTTDCDKAIAAARAAGAEITVEPKDVQIASVPVTKVRLAFCKGPDGEVIEFFSNQTT